MLGECLPELNQLAERMLNDTVGTLTDEQAARIRIKVIASRIVNNKHFKKILGEADPKMRHEVYLEIAPHVRFKPLPFWAMKFREAKH